MTVRMHVDGMAVNSTGRKHHPNIQPGKNFDLFYKISRGQYRLYDPVTDPKPIYVGDILAAEPSAMSVVEDIEVSETEHHEDSSRFAYETDLRDYLARNLSAIEPGLKLYEDEDHEFNGVEYDADGRRIDILARDANGVFVVIELKVSRGHERTIGQLLRYMGWVSANLADDKAVRGVIVARNVDKDLRLAAALVPNVALVEYKLSFRLTPIVAPKAL